MPEPHSPPPEFDLTRLADAFVLHRLSRLDSYGADERGEQTLEVLRGAAGLLSLQSGRGLRGEGNRTLTVLMTALTAAVACGACRLLFEHPEHGGFFSLQTDGSFGGAPSLSDLTPIARDAFDSGETRTSSSQTALLIPLRRHGRVFGLIELSAPRAAAFTPADRQLGEKTAPAIAELAASLGLLTGTAKGIETPFRLIEPPASTADLSGHELVLSKILVIAVEVLDADRGMIFVYDAETDELCARYAEGLAGRELRVASRLGLPGAAFHMGEIVNVADAYLDSRFHPALDWEIGYRTRSVLCAPIFGNQGQHLGVVQLLNKRNGTFNAADERTLKALASQMGVTIDYGVLFEQTLAIRAYNDHMLRSLSNGVVTVDLTGIVTFANQAAGHILQLDENLVIGKPLADLVGDLNIWIAGAVEEVNASGAERLMPNSELYLEAPDTWLAANLSFISLRDSKQVPIGTMILIEDLQREKELRRTMSRFVSNEVIDRLIADPSGSLQGSSHDVTILFSDIRSFTTMTERLGAGETVAMLNEYFSFMEDVITHHSGIIDKYIGDAIMALFGSPFPAADDAENAVRASIDMLQALELLNTRRRSEGKAAIRIGIGIGTGEVITGSIGSPKRTDFTVIGDSVNLASRIESATKRYGAEIIVCSTTWSRLSRSRRGRRLDLVRLRGHLHPTELWQILDHRSDFPEPALAAYNAAFEAYQNAEWDRALRLFQETASIVPRDKATIVMADRCVSFLTRPPSEWDGAVDLE